MKTQDLILAELLIVGQNAQIAERCRIISDDFHFNYSEVKNVDDLFELETMPQPKIVILIATETEGQSEMANQVQVIRQCCPQSYILAIAGRRVTADTAVFVKKSGANCVILDFEAIESCKLEFIVMQSIRSAFNAVKATEFKVNTKVEFNIYHLMPMAKKFLPAHRQGNILSQAKWDKLQIVSEIYIRREDIGLYTKYIQDNTDKSAEGLNSRCRANFLALTSAFIDIVLLLIDQSEASSLDAGRQLFERCKATGKDLLANLSAAGEAWEVVTTSAIGSMGSIDRAPAVAAYAGLLSLLTGIGQPEEVVLASLLCDMGTLNLHPSIMRKLISKSNLNAEEKQSYERHPKMSVEMCLERKLPLSEEFRTIIFATHERADGNGFQKTIGTRIPIVSQLIQLSQMIDSATCIRWGEKRKDPNVVRRQVIDENLTTGIFSPTLITKAKAAC